LRSLPNAFSGIWTRHAAGSSLSRDCSHLWETIAGAVETVRRLVDEFSTLARFPWLSRSRR